MEDALDRVQAYSIDTIAHKIASIGFKCTRCGACCRGGQSTHTATIFPDEVRAIATETDAAWSQIARPMPYGLDEDGRGQTIEWAIDTNDCGDCTFLSTATDPVTCTIYDNRPSICQTYPFLLIDDPAYNPEGEVAASNEPVVALPCPGVGRPMSESQARELAEAVLAKTTQSIHEAIAVKEHIGKAKSHYSTLVIDSEGPKTSSGRSIDIDGERQR